MKQRFTLFFMIVLFLASCSKDKETSPSVVNAIEGTWGINSSTRSLQKADGSPFRDNGLSEEYEEIYIPGGFSLVINNRTISEVWQGETFTYPYSITKDRLTTKFDGKERAINYTIEGNMMNWRFEESNGVVIVPHIQNDGNVIEDEVIVPKIIYYYTLQRK